MHTTGSARKCACMEPHCGEPFNAAARVPYFACASEGMQVSTCMRMRCCAKNHQQICRYEDLRRQEAAMQKAACTFTPRINRRRHAAPGPRPYRDSNPETDPTSDPCTAAAAPPSPSAPNPAQCGRAQQQPSCGTRNRGPRAWWPGFAAPSKPKPLVNPVQGGDAPPGAPAAALRPSRCEAENPCASPDSGQSLGGVPLPKRTPVVATRLYTRALESLRRREDAAEQAAQVC